MMCIAVNAHASLRQVKGLRKVRQSPSDARRVDDKSVGEHQQPQRKSSQNNEQVRRCKLSHLRPTRANLYTTGVRMELNGFQSGNLRASHGASESEGSRRARLDTASQSLAEIYLILANRHRKEYRAFRKLPITGRIARHSRSELLHTNKAGSTRICVGSWHSQPSTGPSLLRFTGTTCGM
jgi:hypothetical protein